MLDTGTKRIKKVKDYRLLEPVYTIIWMVDDTFNFQKEDYVSFKMTPEILIDFVQNKKLWNKKEIQILIKEHAKVIKVLSNKSKDIDFFARNRLMFLFQKNIVKNKKIEKYVRWFDFAEKTKNTENKEEDFRKFESDPPFDEIIRRLNKTILTNEDLSSDKLLAREQSLFGGVNEGTTLNMKPVRSRVDIVLKALQPIGCYFLIP